MFCVFPIEKNLQKLDITFTYQKLSSATFVTHLKTLNSMKWLTFMLASLDFLKF